MPQIAAAANTVIPALRTLEELGFVIEVNSGATGVRCRATRGEEIYVAEDPVSVLGLVRLVELRGWDWGAADVEIEAAMERYALG